MGPYVRNATPEDINEVVRVEEEAWPEEIRATREKFEKRLEIFSKGFFVVSLNNEVVGASTSEIINYDPENPPISWEEITDNGFIEKTHNKNGNAIYVVSVGVTPRVSGKGCGSALVRAQIELTKELGLDYLVLGSRVPGYYNYKDRKIEDYLVLRNENNESVDPEVRFYERQGLKVVRAVPNYMENDPESLNYGVVMVWENK